MNVQRTLRSSLAQSFRSVSALHARPLTFTMDPARPWPSDVQRIPRGQRDLRKLQAIEERGCAVATTRSQETVQMTVASTIPTRQSAIIVHLREGFGKAESFAALDDAKTTLLQPVAIEPGERISRTRCQRCVRPASKYR